MKRFRFLVRTAIAALLAVPPVILVMTPVAAGAAAAPAAAVAETSAINQYANEVNTIGITRFPGTFTGAALTNATTVTIYTVANNKTVLAALRAIPAHGARLVVRVVAHSFRDLDSLARRIGTESAAAGSFHVAIGNASVDPVHGRVLVTLARPAGAVTAAATATATMVDTGRARLDARYGADWVSVAPTTQAVITGTASRGSDSSPWTAGDHIHVASFGDDCTLGFTTRGNKSGNEFMLTAGHCGTGTVTANGTTVGTVSTQYLFGPGFFDFDTIRTDGRARVWYNGNGTTGNYVVTGQTIPALNSQMTVDGGVNPPQHTGLTVTDNDAFPMVTNVQGTFKVGPMVAVSSGSACVGGDSGGPAYVRLGSTGNVNAVGTIEATSPTSCYIAEIGPELNEANLSLVTG